MKTFLRILFFILLTTQICLGQEGYIDRDISKAVTEEIVDTDSTILIKRIDHISAYYNSIAEVDSMLNLFNGILGLPQWFSPAIRDVVNSPNSKFYNGGVYLGNVFLEFITFNIDTINPPTPTCIPYFNAFAFANEIQNTAAILDARSIPRSQVFHYTFREPDQSIPTLFSNITLNNFYNNELLVFFCQYHPELFDCESFDFGGLPTITYPDSQHIYYSDLLESLDGGSLTLKNVKNIVLASSNYEIYRQRLNALFFPTGEDEPGKWSPPAGPSVILQSSQTTIKLATINIAVDSLQKAKQFLIANGLGFEEGEDYLKLDLSANIGVDIILGDYKIVWATESYLDKGYMKMNTDTILFRTKFCNLYNLEFIPHLIYTNSDSTIIDSLELFDDGLHDDSLANDGLYSAQIPPQTTEDWFSLSVSTNDNQTNRYFSIPVDCKFTTAGPVVLDSISCTKTSTYYAVKTYIRNFSANTTITNASVKLICDDSWVLPISPDVRDLPTIPPGGEVKNSFSFIVRVIDSLFINNRFNFKVQVMSDGWPYWTDSTQVVVTGIEDELNEIPSEFLLSQNWPNPFNSSCAIKFSIPKSSQVSLKIFNTLGQEIETLVNEEKPAGTYELNWNAANLPSGVYIYKMKAGEYVETRKMVLLK